MVTSGTYKKKRIIRDNPWWAQTIIYLLLTMSGLATVLPMLNVLAVSLSSGNEVIVHPLMLWPRSFTIEAFAYIFNTPVLIRSFGISVFVTVVGTFFNLVFTTLAAYGLSKTYLPGRKILMWLFVLNMLIQAGLIPNYIWLKNLGLLNSVWIMVISGLVSSFNLILVRNFFWQIPDSLEESARIDGGSDLQVFWNIFLPLSKPVLATVGLFYAVGHWNDFFTGLFYINDNTKWPLQVVMRSIVIDQTMLNMGGSSDAALESQIVPENIKSAAIIFSMVPILMVYPLLQKHFVKGILLGSVKG